MEDLADPTYIEDKADEIKPHVVKGSELNDLNRGRKFLADLARRENMYVFKTIEEAVQVIPKVAIEVREQEVKAEAAARNPFNFLFSCLALA
jgi:hypothetical protein